MAGPGNILIKVGADTGKAVSELGKVNSTLGDTMTASEKMGAGLRKAALPAAAALTGIAVAAVGAAKAAAEDAAEQEHLAGVLKRTTGATTAQISATEDWISKQAMATGVADSELRPALEKIVTATGDVTKSQALMGQALDIAAASGKSVDAVSAAIAKGYTGQTAALEKLIPGLSQAAKESDNFGVIMEELGQKTGGAAAEGAATAAGQYKIFQLQIAELQEELGAALLPVLDALLPILRQAAEFAANNTAAIKVLVGVVATLAAGILIANGVLKAYAAAQAVVRAATAAWTAAQWLLNAALSANPIGIVIVAIAALGAALVVAYTKSETFRNIVNAAFNAVKANSGLLKTAFTALLGPLALVVTHADQIAAAFRSVYSAILSVIGAIQNLISWLGRIKVPKIDLPGPFSLSAPAVPGVSGVAARGAAGTTAAGSGGVTINIHGSLDPEGTARAIRRLLDAHDRRQGRIFR